MIVEFNPASNLYSIEAKIIRFGELSFVLTDYDLGPMKMFIDSGATFSYFPAKFYSQIVAQITNLASFLQL